MKSHLAGKIIVFIQILLSAALLFLLKTSGLVPADCQPKRPPVPYSAATL